MSEKVEILTENEAVKSLAYPIEVKVYEGGTQLVPSSGTITVKNPGGTAQVEDVAVSVAAGGTMTYSLVSTITTTLWENAIIELSYIVSTVTYKAIFLFDVVLNRLKCNIIDQDLKDYFPALAANIWSVQSPANYDVQIQEGFNIVKRDIKDKGRRPHMLIDGSQIRECLILKTFELIFFAFAKDEEDIWWNRYLMTKEKYEERFSKLVIKYDEDEDGLIEGDEGDVSLSQITLKR